MLMPQKKLHIIAVLALYVCTPLSSHPVDLLDRLKVTGKECLTALNASRKIKDATLCKLYLNAELSKLERLDDRVSSHEYTIHVLNTEVSKSRIDHHQAEIKKIHDERSRCIQSIKEFVQRSEVIKANLGITKQSIDDYIQQRRDERSRSRQQGDKENQQLFGNR
jgi:hypothetical protein